jgi:hypothetical protein
MRLFLDTSFETEWGKRQWARISSHWNMPGHPIIWDSPEACDFILITLASPRESYESTIAKLSQLFRNSPNRDRICVFDSGDCPAGLFPGIYTSLRRYLFSSNRHRTGCYTWTFNEFVDYKDPGLSNPEFIFSFQGNLTSRVRNHLLSLKFDRSDVHLEKSEPFWHRIADPELLPFKKRYADMIWRSKFVLCPRGIGASSFRLFEAMQSGRAPVIISDQWVPCSDIDWNKICLRVRERDIAKLPEICQANEHRWVEMGREARRIWVEWFSQTGLAKLIYSSLTGIARTRRYSESVYLLQWPLRLALHSGRTAAARYIPKALSCLRF